MTVSNLWETRKQLPDRKRSPPKRYTVRKKFNNINNNNNNTRGRWCRYNVYKLHVRPCSASKDWLLHKTGGKQLSANYIRINDIYNKKKKIKNVFNYLLAFLSNIPVTKKLHEHVSGCKLI